MFLGFAVMGRDVGTGDRDVARGLHPHLVIAAAGSHTVLDVGHEGVNEPRVVPHGLAASISRAQVPAGEGQGGGGGG